MPLQVDVEALVEAGAVPENNDDGKSPLFIAAERGKGNVLRYHSFSYLSLDLSLLCIARYLLGQFAGMKRRGRGAFAIDIDLPDHKGDTCLHAAVRRCNQQASADSIVEMLLGSRHTSRHSSHH